MCLLLDPQARSGYMCRVIMWSSGVARRVLIAAASVLAAAVFVFWYTGGKVRLPMRIPGTDLGPDGQNAVRANPVLTGKVILGTGAPGKTEGDWPQFRGPARDGISLESTPLARSWPGTGPKILWATDVGEGYAGPAVAGGRVYLMDYDREKKQDALRCLSFDTGEEIWRFTYPVAIKRNHGMSRTVPSVSSNMVVAIGPKCHIAAVNAETGALLWGMDMVREFGTTVPPWYAGQCPLIEGDRLILAPGGKDALLVAAKAASGEIVWKSPNPRGWKMTHSSIMPIEVEGERMYIYCADKGVAGVSARDGAILWDTTDWKISIATVPSPLALDGGRVFLSGGYNAGSMMIRIRKTGDTFGVESLFRLAPSVFGATQQSPVFYQGHIYGVRPDGKFTCLTPEGKTLWTSEGKPFGLGPFVLGSGLVYGVNDNGLLRLLEATPAKFTPLAQAQVLTGREAWGPLALTSGRLLARDLTRMVCIEVK